MSEHEVILAQQQGVTMRPGGRTKEIEAEFGFDETQGTLILTNTRLVFACLDEKSDSLQGENMLDPTAGIHIIYSEVEDLSQVSPTPPNAVVPIAAIGSVKGHAGGIGRPSLDVEWSDGGNKRVLVFVEGVTKRKGKGLNDWAAVIERLKGGTLKLVSVPEPPSTESLEGKVARVLGDMQEWGVLTIEEKVEKEFKLDLDPDEVQAACDGLVSAGVLKKNTDSVGEALYRRASALGEEDFSS